MKRNRLVFGERLQKRGAFRRGASAPGLLGECCPPECRKPKMLLKICRKFAAGNQIAAGTYGESWILILLQTEGRERPKTSLQNGRGDLCR